MLDFNSGKPWEKICFTAIGRDASLYDDLLKEAFELSSNQEEGKTVIFTNWGSEWRAFGHPRRKRDLSSVILDGDTSERIVNDIQQWRSSKNWYFDKGIPYRRGYLLHGSPGSGKSSFVFALAGALDYNICMLNLNEQGLTDDRLALALSTVPERSIVLLEDIDAAFNARDAAESYGSAISFTGLLNVLDGVTATEERLLFMTTNHIERLDPALIRPGRVDLVERLGNASHQQQLELFKRFYPDATEHQMEQFKKLAPSEQSMAKLQGHFLRYKDDPQLAIDCISQLTDTVQYNPLPVHEVKSVRRRKRKDFNASDVDKMFFNPQEGWEK